MVKRYYEKCDRKYLGSNVPFFVYQLSKIEKISKVIRHSIPATDCLKCNTNQFYQLGHLVWSQSMIHKITDHCCYPSNYFVITILAIKLANNYLINPPLQMKNNLMATHQYVALSKNKLSILDALLKEGSCPRYIYYDNQVDQFIYSEHAGSIAVKNGTIGDIVVSTTTHRVDTNKPPIFLPTNKPTKKCHFVFHTHPNATTYGGRIKYGVIYEFPSVADLTHFTYYYDTRRIMGSIVIAPEGMYVIRLIKHCQKASFETVHIHPLQQFILELEKVAINDLSAKIVDEDSFHYWVSKNYTYIQLYNRYIQSLNLFVEYYPRILFNNEWCLQPVLLQFNPSF